MATLVSMALPVSVRAQETKTQPRQEAKVEAKFELPPLAKSDVAVDFEAGLEPWKVLDNGWKMAKHRSEKGKQVLSLFQKKSNYKPPFRSPLHIALVKDHSFDSFQLDAKVLSTHKDYNHRDVCLFLGYVSPAEYYYVHLGKKMDPNANQIFIVNQAARTKISLTTTDGTDWDEEWHHVRIVRDHESGKIEVYFDDMDKPVMTAKDKTFGRGMVGVGSFDDTADFAELSVKRLTNQSVPNSKQ